MLENYNNKVYVGVSYAFLGGGVGPSIPVYRGPPKYLETSLPGYLE